MKTNEQKDNKKKRTLSLPHVFAILVILALLAAVASWFVPAGEFERLDNGEVVPNSYQVVESSPVNIFEVFMAIPEGLESAAMMVFTVFIIGGSFAVIKDTKIIDVLVGGMAQRLSGRKYVLIAVIMSVISLISAFIGLLELSLVYIPILIPICLAIGFDSVTAAAIALAGSAAGFTAALTNPFTLAISQEIGGLELYSGIGYRSITLLVMTMVAILFVINYARKIEENPEKSFTFERDQEKHKEIDKIETPAFTWRIKLVAFVTIVGFLTLIVGILQFDWYLKEINAIFILTALLGGLVAGFGINAICEKFIFGLQDFVLAAFAAGIARAIPGVLEDANILDTVVNGLSLLVQALPSSITAFGMLLTQAALNFLIPAGSGQALATMPIMFPLADITNVTRQVAILAFQFGDGFSNIFYPTSGFLWACIGMAGIPYQKWVRFLFPLILIWYMIAAIFVIVGQAIGWS